MSAPVFDIVAIGDTTEDVFLQMSDAEVHCDNQGGNCKFCLRFADKIAVEKKTDVPAVGNAANHAIGVARLGLRAAIYTVLGDDVQGHLAQDVFRENGVDARYVVFDKEHGTNFSAVINFNSERTILVYHEPREYRLPHFARPRWIYLTSSSGGGVKSLHEQVLAYLEENPEVKIAFNPGTHQMNLGLEGLKPLLEKTEVLFINREESQELLRISSDDVGQLIKGFLDIGVGSVVLTDGPNGSYAVDGGKILRLKIFAGEVVERTGAGDSYGAGFMGALVHGKTITEAMLWGNANSTSVVRYIGAREGLLNKDGVEQLIRKNSKIKPVVYGTI